VIPIEDKNKVGLLYTGMGAIAGIISGLLTDMLFPGGKFINLAIYALCILMLYLTTFLLPYLDIDMEKQGKTWKIMLQNAFSFGIAWVVIWALLHELIRY